MLGTGYSIAQQGSYLTIMKQQGGAIFSVAPVLLSLVTTYREMVVEKRVQLHSKDVQSLV